MTRTEQAFIDGFRLGCRKDFAGIAFSPRMAGEIRPDYDFEQVECFLNGLEDGQRKDDFRLRLVLEKGRGE